MFTQYTFTDWNDATETERPELLLKIINAYKGSADFQTALVAYDYFNANNREVGGKVLMQPRVFTIEDEETGRTKKSIAQEAIVGNRVYSNFLFRFVTQQNQFLLGNGVTLESPEQKERLGLGFDKALELAGEKALLCGLCWGYWNLDHLEVIPAVTDGLSGFVALLNERTAQPAVGIRFWQLDPKRPMHVQLFEAGGITEYREDTEKHELVRLDERKGYTQTVTADAAGEVERVDNASAALPLVPFYANESAHSELTPAIKSKIDLYDRIFSDFGDNLDKANDVYWVLNNFGGSTSDIAEMLHQIHQLRAVANISDGSSSSTAEPKAFEVPYQARQTALELLSKALYQDYMALSMDELTGGSLTNVAIEAAMTNLNLKADRFEWQAFRFVQGILRLAGIETEEITFKRQSFVNRSEIVQDIYTMHDDLDRETRLMLNPYIMQEQIPDILANLDAQDTTGASSLANLEKATREE